MLTETIRRGVLAGALMAAAIPSLSDGAHEARKGMLVSTTVLKAAKKAAGLRFHARDIEFFTRDALGNWTLVEAMTSDKNAETDKKAEAPQNPEGNSKAVASNEIEVAEQGDVENKEVLVLAKFSGKPTEGWIFPLGDELTALIDNAKPHGFLDTAISDWQGIVERKFKFGRKDVAEIVFPKLSTRIIDGGEPIQILVRGRDDQALLPWAFPAKRLSELTSFDFSPSNDVDTTQTYDADKLLPPLRVLGAWPKKGMDHPAFFKDQLRHLKKVLDRPNATVLDLGEAVKTLHKPFSLEDARFVDHWFANVRWDKVFDEWWQALLPKQYQGDANTVHFVKRAGTAPYRELVATTGMKLPWLDQIVASAANLQAQWRALEADGKQEPAAFPNFARRDLTSLLAEPGRVTEDKRQFLEDFTTLMNRRATTLAEVCDFIRASSRDLRGEAWDSVESQARFFREWLDRARGATKPAKWIIRDYAIAHEADKPLFNLEGEIGQVNAFVVELLKRVKVWALLP